MMFVKQNRETVPRNQVSYFRVVVLSAGKIIRIVCTILFVPPPQQTKVEEARIRASELSGHFIKHGGA